MLQYLDGIIALILLVAGAITIMAARRRGQDDSNAEALAVAQSAVQMMKVQVEVLRSDMEARTLQVAQLNARIEVLESLVSQRYDLGQIQEDLAYVKGKIDELT
jgi:TolA-binding protein